MNTQKQKANEAYEDFMCFASHWARSYRARKAEESLRMEEAKKRLTCEDYAKMELFETPIEEYIRLYRSELLFKKV